MLRISAFLDLWRGWRHAVKRYLSFSGTRFHAGTLPPPSANSDNPPDDIWETDGGGTRLPVSWLGLGQSFSAVDVAEGERAERPRLPAECG